MIKNNLELVNYVNSLLSRKTIYMIGGIGRVLTEANIQASIARGYTHTAQNITRIRKGIGSYAFDCNAIIKVALWETAPGKINYNVPAGSDLGSKTLYERAKKKGKMTTMPNVLGTLVFTADLGHVGVYVGMKNGVRQYAEATPAWDAWGVTTSADKNHPQGHNRTWTYWGYYHLINYIEAPSPAEPALPPSGEGTFPKYIVGDRVVVSGKLYRQSNAAAAAGSISNRKTTVTRFAKGALHPYNTTGDLGWMDEKDIALEKGVTVPADFKVGDQIQRVKAGNTNSYGTGKATAKSGKGWIVAIYSGRKFPYHISNKKGSTASANALGFYQLEGLKRV